MSEDSIRAALHDKRVPGDEEWAVEVLHFEPRSNENSVCVCRLRLVGATTLDLELRVLGEAVAVRAESNDLQRWLLGQIQLWLLRPATKRDALDLTSSPVVTRV